MNVNPQELSYKDFSRIILSSVAPRPIAWVSTIDQEGNTNLAPFSFFTCVSSDPPMLAFAPELRREEQRVTAKDTIRNVQATGEFAVNIVSYPLARAMKATSEHFAPTICEFSMANLRTRPSKLIKPPQVAETLVSFECKVHQIIDFGIQKDAGGHLVIGQIVSVYVDDSIMQNGKVDQNLLDVIGVIGSKEYARTNNRFSL